MAQAGSGSWFRVVGVAVSGFGPLRGRVALPVPSGGVLAVAGGPASGKTAVIAALSALRRAALGGAAPVWAEGAVELALAVRGVGEAVYRVSFAGGGSREHVCAGGRCRPAGAASGGELAAALEAGREAARRIAILGVPGWGLAREPDPLAGSGWLREDLSNLAAVAQRLWGDRLSEHATALVSLTLGAGRVEGWIEDRGGAPRLVVEVEGVRVPQELLPHSAAAALGLAVAQALEPSLIAVDHSVLDPLPREAQDLLLAELRDGEPAAVVSTGSEQVLDLLRHGDFLVVLAREGREVVVKIAGDAGRLAEEASRLGLSLGEAVAYGVLEARGSRGRRAAEAS